MLIGERFLIDSTSAGPGTVVLSLQIVSVLELRREFAVVRELASMNGDITEPQEVEYPLDRISLLKIDDVLDAQHLGRDVDVEAFTATWRELNAQGVVNARAREALIATLSEAMHFLSHAQVSSIDERALSPRTWPHPEWKSILKDLFQQAIVDPDHAMWRNVSVGVSTSGIVRST